MTVWGSRCGAGVGPKGGGFLPNNNAAAGVSLPCAVRVRARITFEAVPAHNLVLVLVAGLALPLRARDTGGSSLRGGGGARGGRLRRPARVPVKYEY